MFFYCYTAVLAFRSQIHSYVTLRVRSKFSHWIWGFCVLGIRERARNKMLKRSGDGRRPSSIRFSDCFPASLRKRPINTHNAPHCNLPNANTLSKFCLLLSAQNTHSLTHSRTHSFTHSPIHLLTHPLTNSLTHPLTHPTTHHLLTHGLTHLFT
jgi:hypothetical protein